MTFCGFCTDFKSSKDFERWYQFSCYILSVNFTKNIGRELYHVLNMKKRIYFTLGNDDDSDMMWVYISNSLIHLDYY